MVIYKVLLFVILFGGKAFALFPFEEMKKNPLFDSLFVLHSEEEKRVDDSLYGLYGKVMDTYDFSLLVKDDPRVPKWMRKVVVVETSSELNKYIRKLRSTNVYRRRVGVDGKYFRHNKISDFSDDEEGALDKRIKSIKSVKNLKKSDVQNFKINFDEGVAMPPDYYPTKVDSSNGVTYFRIDPQFDLKLYRAAYFYIKQFNRDFKQEKVSFHVVKFNKFLGFDIGIEKNGVKCYLENNGTVILDKELVRLVEIKTVGNLNFITDKNPSMISIPRDSVTFLLENKFISQREKKDKVIDYNIDVVGEMRFWQSKYFYEKDEEYKPFSYYLYKVLVTDDRSAEYWTIAIDKKSYNLTFKKPLFSQQTNQMYYPNLYYYYKIKTKELK